MVWRRNAVRTYRLLLRAYPAEFRHEYGQEMETLFATRLTAEPPARLWLEVVADTLLTASAEHCSVLAADLRQSMRALIKSPALLIASSLTIMLGTGVTTTVFSLMNAVLLRSLPYGNSAQLVYMWTPLDKTAGVEKEVAPPYIDMAAWRNESHTLSSITSLQRFRATLNNENTSHVGAARVLGNFFETLDVHPKIGRTLHPKDETPGNQFVAVISDLLWRSNFAGDPEILGKTIHLDDKYYRVVGVMPKQFSYPHGNDLPGQYQFASLPHTDIWVPAAFTEKELTDPDFGLDAVIGRLRSGATLSQAQFEISAFEKRLSPLHSHGVGDMQALLVPFAETILGPARPLLRLLTGSVILVLLMACCNLAGLLLARATDRAAELGLRTALGANRSRLVRLMMTESLMLSLLGTFLAIPFSFAALNLLARLNPGDIPRLDEASIDTRVLLFSLLVSIGTGITAGILPALNFSDAGVGELIRQQGRGVTARSLRIRNALIVAEIALSVVLLAGSGLFIRSYLAVLGEDKGFAESTLTMSIELDGHTPNHDNLLREIMNRIRTLPGVEAAGSIDDLPLSSFEDKGFLTIEGYTSPLKQTANVRSTGGEYFRAMQIPLLAGRYLEDRDITAKPTASRQTVVVSNSFVKRYFSGRNAIGRRLQVNELGWWTIVGVVGDIRHSSLEQAPEPAIYVQDGVADSVVILAKAPAKTVIASVRQIARSVGHRIAVTDIQTMRQYVYQASAHRRFQTAVLTFFAAVSIVLALIGIYGLLSYAVRQRTAEIGIRMAMGASRGAILAMVGSYGLRLALAGLVIGVFLALSLTKIMAHFLYGVSVLDLPTFLAVPALTLVVAAIACLVPGLKACSIDPINTLREQ